ncbi:hypothetical protein AB0D87_25910 [Streptomyces sp. NPDC048342]|uniref:hypothetical protein n=1 Tax=unclassified Streptomyces TaxID=2593676 RepID=UPI00343CB6CE
MRQSITALHKGRDWMDRERDFHARFHPDKIRVEMVPLVRLMNDRHDVLDRCLARIEAAGRVPRVCIYLLAARGCEPAHSRNAARDYALEEGWQVSTLQMFTDRFGVTDPLLRPGWSAVRHQIRAGFVDGVVALTHSVISPHLDEYELQLALVEKHGGFVALVTPETAGTTS